MHYIEEGQQVSPNEVSSAIYNSMKFFGVLPLFSGAICSTVDPEIFFPEQGGSPKEAKKICSQCPDRIPCRDFAFQHNIQHGVWGGLTSTDRRKLLKLVEIKNAS